MQSFAVHTVESAPDGSRPALQKLKDAFGLVPNLAAAMAESPELLTGFLGVRDIVHGGSFSPGEVQVLALTSAFENGCAWCMAFHTTLALKEGVSAQAVQALRAGRSPEERRLKALSDYARSMIRRRGDIDRGELTRFLAEGFSRREALEVVLAMAFYLMANYAGHLTEAPLNEPFKAHAWTRPQL